MSSRIAHARTCRGRIARLRVAIPEDEGRYCLHWIDETAAADDPPRLLYGRVQSRMQDPAGEPAHSLRNLESMTARAAPVNLGLIAAAGEDEDWVHWVVADDDSPGLMPPHRASVIDRALAGGQRWLPGFLAACFVAVASMLWLISGAGDEFLMWCAVLALVVSSLAALMTGIMLYEHAATLLENHRYREAIEASEVGLRRARARVRERPAAASQSAVQNEAEAAAKRDIERYIGRDIEPKDYDPLPPRRPPARGKRKRRANHGR